MQPLDIQATNSSPAIVFTPEQGRLTISGESYPENCVTFYKPLFESVAAYLETQAGRPLTLDMEIIYFNSTSSKAFMNLFDLLDEAAEKGHDITVNWRYHEDNDIAMECGEEFQEDVSALTFNLRSFGD